MSNYGLSLVGIAAALCIVWAEVGIAQVQSQAAESVQADVLQKEGSAACREGRYADAERALRETVALRERTFAPTAFEVGTALNDLAAAIHYQGRYAEAEPLYRRAIAIFQQHPDRIADRAAAMGNLASVYRELTRMKE